MRTVNIHEAKTHLSRLVEQVANGEAVVIAKAGKPMAKMVPLTAGESASPPRIGFMKGELLIPDDFDRMGEEEIARLFGGSE